MMVWLNAWPMCSVPVTFGGGNWMEKFFAPSLNVGGGKPRFSHSGPHWDSMF